MEEFNRKSQVGAVAYFRSCLKNKDVKGAMSCFDSQGIYIDSDGKEIRGRTQIEKAISTLCALELEIKGSEPHLTTIGDLSLWLDEWEMIGKTPDGHLIKNHGHTTCLMKRNEEGVWLWLVDNPFGAAVLKRQMT